MYKILIHGNYKYGYKYDITDIEKLYIPADIAIAMIKDAYDNGYSNWIYYYILGCSLGFIAGKILPN